MALRLGNDTAGETWAVEKITARVQPGGRVRKS
jgi:hypothetical protein